MFIIMNSTTIDEVINTITLFNDTSNNILSDITKQKNLTMMQVLDITSQNKSIKLLEFIELFDKDPNKFVDTILHTIVKDTFNITIVEPFDMTDTSNNDILLESSETKKRKYDEVDDYNFDLLTDVDITVKKSDITTTRLSFYNTIKLYKIKSLCENIPDFDKEIYWRVEPEDKRKYGIFSPTYNSYFTQVDFIHIYNTKSIIYSNIVSDLFSREFNRCQIYVKSNIKTFKNAELNLYYHKNSKILLISSRILTKVVLAHKYFTNYITNVIH